MKKLFSLLSLLTGCLLAVTAQDSIVISGNYIEDAYINSTNYAPNGHSPTLIAAHWTYGGYEGVGRSLIKFDLTEIPEYAQVLNAKLSLYHDPTSEHIGHSNMGGDNTGIILRIVEDWSDDEVTWYTQPLTTNTNSVIIPPPESNDQDYPDIDVTDLIQDMINQPDLQQGLMIKLFNEYNIYRSLVFASVDHADPELRPKLVIAYTDCTLPTSNFTYVSVDSSFIFTDLSLSADSWYWDFGDGYFSSLQNPEHVYGAFGNYLVCLTVTDSCGSNTFCDTIHYCKPPSAAFNFVIDDKTIAFQNLSGNGDAYYWDFGDAYFSDLENPVHNYSDYGLYEVCLSVTNECDTSKICDTVEIINSGVSENFLYAVNVYPNPLMSSVTISYELRHPEMISITFYNYLGQVVWQKEENQTKGKQQVVCDLKDLTDGMYYYRLKVGDAVVNGKVIKAR